MVQRLAETTAERRITELYAETKNTKLHTHTRVHCLSLNKFAQLLVLPIFNAI